MEKSEFLKQVEKNVAALQKMVKKNGLAPAEHVPEEVVRYGLITDELYSQACLRMMVTNMPNDAFELRFGYCEKYAFAEWWDGLTQREKLAYFFKAFREMAEGCADDYKRLAELVIVTNLKSWEHASRNNNRWGKLYAEAYYLLKDLYWDAFGKDEAACSYWFDWVD